MGSMQHGARRWTELAVVLAAVSTGVTGCSTGSSNPLAGQQATQAANAGNFSTTIFLGDSLTAGYQSSSLLDTQQVHGWAPLVAAQGSFGIVQPLIAPPGAPAVLELVSVGPPPVIKSADGVTTGRDNFSAQPTDLAVPGALVNDVANTVPKLIPTSGQEIINQLVLGYPSMGYGVFDSQATQAIKANPTTIFLWIGNNDVLVADLTGTPNSMTTLANFTTQYQALITELTTKTSAHLVIGNIPDVTAVPYLTPAATVLGLYSQATGLPTATLSALFGIVPGDYVTPAGTTEIGDILAHRQTTPLDDAGVLTAAEVVTVKAQVTAFNQVIAAQASAAGATLVDINALFAQITASGLAVNGFTGNTSFLGGFFSLDGIHPTNTGYAVVANKFIDTMNAAFKGSIPDVPLSPIATIDPLWPPNIASHLVPAMIPAKAGMAVHDALLGVRTPTNQIPHR